MNQMDVLIKSASLADHTSDPKSDASSTANGTYTLTDVFKRNVNILTLYFK